MCPRIPPDLEHVPVGDSLVARYERRPLRGARVLIEGQTAARWAPLRPPAAFGPFCDPARKDLYAASWALMDPTP